MKRLAVVLLALTALAAPAVVSAHPLGNFTVNRFSGIELSGSRIYVHYVLDLAEIPTYQEGGRVRAASFPGEVGRRLVLRLNGRRLSLMRLEHKVGERPGAGGLPTLRFEAIFAAEAPVSGGRLVFQDTNFKSRVGWREVVVRAEAGSRILSSTAPAASRSDRLRAYPQNLLEAPLDVDSATVEYQGRAGAGAPPTLGPAPPSEREGSGFESLAATEDLGVGVILLSLLVAAFWGAAHALTPGHGKAIVAGYLVGSRGCPRHAVLLGLIVTATHTAGVFGLGLVTLFLSNFVVPERLYPWLTVASGLMVVGVGASVLSRRCRRARHHAHHHHGEEEIGTRGLLGIGIAAGLLPCPSALVVLLSAISLHRVGLGLALILAFSVGLAATITGIGLLAVLARRVFTRISLDGPLLRALPAASAFLILAVGIGITVNALPEVL